LFKCVTCDIDENVDRDGEEGVSARKSLSK